MPTSTVLLLGVLAGLIAVFVVGNDWVRRRARMGRRVRQFADILELELGEQEPVPVSDGERSTAPANPLIEVLERRFPLSGARRTALASVAAGVVATVLLVPALNFVGLPFVIAILAAPGVGAAFGWNIGSVLEQGVRRKYAQRLLVALDDFERMVRFGIGVGAAFSSVAATAEEPVKTSFRRVTLAADIGAPLHVALSREAHRIRVSELAMLAASMATQSTTGGGLAESVGNVAEMLREHLDNLERMQSAISEPKISLLILACVPFAAAGLQFATQPELVDTLLSEARHLLGIGVGLIVCGLVVAWLIVRSAQR